jgi:hypothetical protein
MKVDKKNERNKLNASRVALLVEGGKSSRKAKTCWKRKCTLRRFRNASRAKLHIPFTGDLILVTEGDPCSLAGCLVKRSLDAKKFAPPYPSVYIAMAGSNEVETRARKRSRGRRTLERTTWRLLLLVLTMAWNTLSAAAADAYYRDLVRSVDEATYEAAPWRGEGEMGEGPIEVGSDAETEVAGGGTDNAYTFDGGAQAGEGGAVNDDPYILDGGAQSGEGGAANDDLYIFDGARRRVMEVRLMAIRTFLMVARRLPTRVKGPSKSTGGQQWSLKRGRKIPGEPAS